MMQKAPHFQKAFDLGADVAEAEHHDWTAPCARAPMADVLWRLVMGDEKRADWPANTLPQLRREFEDGHSSYW